MDGDHEQNGGSDVSAETSRSQLANPWKRAAALGIETFVMFSAARVLVGSLWSVPPDALISGFIRDWLVMVLFSVLLLEYLTFTIAKWQTTVAGRILGLRIVSDSGGLIDRHQARRRSKWVLVAAIPLIGQLLFPLLMLVLFFEMRKDPMFRVRWDYWGETHVEASP